MPGEQHVAGAMSISPSCNIASAPAPLSSDGWKIRLSVPEKLRVCAKCPATASRVAVCPSWPQACMTPAWRLTYGHPSASLIGNASISARSPRDFSPFPTLSVPTTPVPPRPQVTLYPHCAVICDYLTGAMFPGNLIQDVDEYPAVCAAFLQKNQAGRERNVVSNRSCCQLLIYHCS